MDYINEVVEQKYSLKSLRKEYNAGKKYNYLLFWGHRPSQNGLITKSCLSQWWKCRFEVNGESFNCMEQFMMAAKARLFGDEETRREIMEASEQKTIKSLGRKVKNFDEKIWNEHKFTIVFYGNLMKFSQNEKIKAFLLSTGKKVLAEASPYDKIWGIQMSADEYGADNPMKWRGENLLGFALMQVRDELL